MSENFSVGDPMKNGKAKTGLVLGIIGLIVWIIPIIGFPVTIVGLVFSIKGLKSLKRKVAIVGIVLSVIGLFLTTASASIGAYLGATGQSYLVNKLVEKAGIKPLDNNTTSKVEKINEGVQAVKRQITLPYKIDEATTIVDVTAEPGAIRYHYALSGIDTSEVTDYSVKNNLKLSICKDSDLMRLLQDMNLEYSYSVENSAQKYFASITKEDCN